MKKQLYPGDSSDEEDVYHEQRTIIQKISDIESSPDISLFLSSFILSEISQTILCIRPVVNKYKEKKADIASKMKLDQLNGIQINSAFYKFTDKQFLVKLLNINVRSGPQSLDNLAAKLRIKTQLFHAAKF